MNARWYTPTPGKLVAGLLAFELCLVAIDRHSGRLCLAGVVALLLVVWLGLIWFGVSLLPRHRFQFGVGTLLLVVAIGKIEGDVAPLILAVLIGVISLGISLLLPQRFQFGIWTLLTLMVVVAVVAGWFSWKWERVERQREALQVIRQFGGTAVFDHDRPSWLLHVTPSWLWGRSSWLWSLLEKDTLANVVEVECPSDFGKGFFRSRPVTDAVMEHLKGLPHLKVLSLNRARVTDAGLEQLKGLTQLEELYLGYTKVTDAGLEHLKGMTQLERLGLDGTDVTDAGLEQLKGLTQLKRLRLTGTQVTDAGLEHLKGMTQLDWLYVDRTQVTAEGVKKLNQSLPDCVICRYP